MKTKTTFYLLLLILITPFYLAAQTPDTTYQYKQEGVKQINQGEQETVEYRLEDESEWRGEVTAEERRNMDKQMIKELRKSERKLEAELKRVDKQIVKLKHEQLRLEQDRENIKRDQKRIREEMKRY